mmetsp:Transcript_9888/g.21059  ORF Transcript_9888/g.21059 Transcript_9888/m.21059 type:complete len:84 (-) Transcript_9888:1806-2057(-)
MLSSHGKSNTTMHAKMTQYCNMQQCNSITTQMTVKVSTACSVILDASSIHMHKSGINSYPLRHFVQQSSKSQTSSLLSSPYYG